MPLLNDGTFIYIGNFSALSAEICLALDASGGASSAPGGADWVVEMDVDLSALCPLYTGSIYKGSTATPTDIAPLPLTSELLAQYVSDPSTTFGLCVVIGVTTYFILATNSDPAEGYSYSQGVYTPAFWQNHRGQREIIA